MSLISVPVLRATIQIEANDAETGVVLCVRALAGAFAHAHDE